jgi:hypothetical protein
MVKSARNGACPPAGGNEADAHVAERAADRVVSGQGRPEARPDFGRGAAQIHRVRPSEADGPRLAHGFHELGDGGNRVPAALAATNRPPAAGRSCSRCPAAPDVASPFAAEARTSICANRCARAGGISAPFASKTTARHPAWFRALPGCVSASARAERRSRPAAPSTGPTPRTRSADAQGIRLRRDTPSSEPRRAPGSRTATRSEQSRICDVGRHRFVAGAAAEHR